MDEEIARIIKSMQTSVHDQISALKADVQKATGDSQAALEICAELERSVNISASDKQRIQQLSDIVRKIIDISSKEATDNDLNFRRLRILSGINHLCWHLSVMAFIKLRVCSDDPKIMFSCIEPLSRLRDLHADFTDKVKSAEKTDDLIPVGEEFADKYLALQDEIQKPPLKFLDGSEGG